MGGWTRWAVIFACVACLSGCALVSTVSVSSSGGVATEAASVFDAALSADGHHLILSSSARNLVSGGVDGLAGAYERDLTSGVVTRVSVSSAGTAANAAASASAVSGDGRFVAFSSSATNLVTSDTTSIGRGYLHDTVAGSTVDVTSAVGGADPNGGLYTPMSVSDNGRYVAFASDATNLVAGDTNGFTDVFVRDVVAGTTVRASMSSAAAQGLGRSYNPVLSGDGRFVAFVSAAPNLVSGDTNNVVDVFLRDLVANTTVRVSVADDESQANGTFSIDTPPSLTTDGRYVAFASTASNLVSGDTNNATDVFVRDIVAGTTTRVSVGTGAVQGTDSSMAPKISADGHRVAFETLATNLVPSDTNSAIDVLERDLVGGTTVRVSVSSSSGQLDGQSNLASISGDGSIVAFTSYASNVVPSEFALQDTYLRNVTAATTVEALADLAPGEPAQSDGPALDANGRHVAFESSADNLVTGDTNRHADIFERDTTNALTTRVSVATAGAQADGDSYGASISRDGRYVAFTSYATNLVPGDTNNTTDVFLRDTQLGTTTRVSVATGGGQASGTSYGASLSADGRYVAFESDAPDLVPGDTNNKSDVFLRDTQLGTTIRVSVATGGTQGDGAAHVPVISADGTKIAFASDSTNLVASDTNHVADDFVYDRSSATTVRVSVGAGGIEGNAAAQLFTPPALSSDGHLVAFASLASNLVTGDTNGAPDDFMRDTIGGTTTRISIGTGSLQGNSGASSVSISADGRFATFSSGANNLVAGDSGFLPDIFVRDLANDLTTSPSVGTYANQNGIVSAEPTLSADGRYVAFDGQLAAGTDQVLIRFTVIPTVTSISPPTVARGTSTTLTVTGTGFLSPVVANFNSTGITITSITRDSETQTRLAITIAPDAPTGVRNLAIVDFGVAGVFTGSAGACYSCLTVT